MKNLIFKKIIKDSQEMLLKLAKKNGWVWFYKLHQKEVMKMINKLLKIYSKADKKILLISGWLHDISKYRAKGSEGMSKAEKNHHIKSAEIAEKILRKYPLSEIEIEKIKNCILFHRNKLPYVPKTLEEKVIAIADTLSHFESIFYLTYFKFHPEHSLEKMVKTDLVKLKRDWRDLGLLPKARKLVEVEYKTLKKLLENYQK